MWEMAPDHSYRIGKYSHARYIIDPDTSWGGVMICLATVASTRGTYCNPVIGHKPVRCPLSHCLTPSIFQVRQIATDLVALPFLDDVGIPYTCKSLRQPI
jgi:hypothetical protein